MIDPYTISDDEFYKIQELLLKAFNNPNDMVRLLETLISVFCAWRTTFPEHWKSLYKANTELLTVATAIKGGRYDNNKP